MKTFIFLSILLCVAYGQYGQHMRQQYQQYHYPSEFRAAQEMLQQEMQQEMLQQEMQQEMLQQEMQQELKEQPPSVTSPLDTKFQSAVNLLINRDVLDEKVLRAAIRHALDATFTSNMVILPTGAVQEPGKATPSFHMFNNTMNKITILLRGLNLKLRMFLTGTDESAAFGSISTHMLEIRDFLLFTKEILETLSMYTKRCDPTGDLSRQEGFCRALIASDESEKIFDGVLKENVNRFIRNPFFWIDAEKAFLALKSAEVAARPDISILTFSTPSLGPGECHSIVEQIAGMKALLRPAKLSLFMHPFSTFSTLSTTTMKEKEVSKMMENKMMWIFEWVPAEYFKTISFCNEMGADKIPSIKRHIDTMVVLDRGLLNLWYPISIDAPVTLPPSGH